jgi:uncharacterized protein YdaU (DUF1376 family)
VKTDIFIPIYLGDYLRDTGDLTTEEHGAYFLILLHMWTADGKLPVARLGQISRLPPERWESAWETLRRFFVVDGSTATQKRLTRELGNAQARRETSRVNGARGGRPNNHPVNHPVYRPGNPDHNPGKTSSPSPSPSQRASDPEARQKPPVLIQSRHETFQQRDARIAREASEQTKVELARDVAATNARLEGIRMDPSKAPTAEQLAGLRRKP